MQNFVQNLPHLLIALAVIGAASALAAIGVITGGEALGVIGAAAGFTMGTSGSSASISAVASAMPAVSSSSGGSTTTFTPQATHVAPLTAATPNAGRPATTAPVA